MFCFGLVFWFAGGFGLVCWLCGFLGDFDLFVGGILFWILDFGFLEFVYCLFVDAVLVSLCRLDCVVRW